MGFDKIKKLLEELEEEMRELGIPEEILEKDVKPFGNASHVILPKGCSNKKVKIIIEK